MGLEGRIWASRLGFGSRGWDMGLKTEIWAWRLGGGGTKKKKKEKKKIPHVCEGIGHRPLRGRCPKGEKNFLSPHFTKFSLEKKRQRGIEISADHTILPKYVSIPTIFRIKNLISIWVRDGRG